MATDVVERLLRVGIRLPDYGPGNRKRTCPKCSHTRRNKSDPCLSVTVDDDAEHAVWNCFNCAWKGSTWDIEAEERRREKEARREARERKEREANRIRSARSNARRWAAKQPPTAPGEPTPEVLAWFAARGIAEPVVRRNRIGAARHWIPALKAEVDCIAFPVFRQGILINVKYRALGEKAFAQEQGGEQAFYGIDDLLAEQPGDEPPPGLEQSRYGTAIIVEGEIDKLSAEMAGYRNVLSVPAGAPNQLKAEASEDDARFRFLGDCEDYLGHITRWVIAVDADGPGQVLEEELARRLGRENCWRVRWPDAGDIQIKDANECLLAHGTKVLGECIETAEMFPVTGLHRMADYVDEIEALYDSLTETGAAQKGLSTGWASVDKFMTIRPGELSIVTGYTHSGKSEFLDALMINLGRLHNWRFAVCSFENLPRQHIPKLLEKYLGAPFADGPTRRMTRDEVLQAMTGWLEDHFVFIRAGDEAPTIDWILEKARVAVLRHGVRGVTIDPYNEIEAKRPPGMTETEYVSQILGKVRRFAENHGCHCWVVAHPAKPVREGGKLPVPTLYDISGSAHWANKADIGLVVHRDLDNGNITELYLRKVRFKEVGQVGVVELQWDRVTGRYSEANPSAGARGYWAD